jgi:hypothetical protein
MRTVLATAAAAFLLLGFAAHGAELPGAPVLNGSACVAGSSTARTPTFGAADESDCCNVNSHCSQYISTQSMVRVPTRGRT